VYSVTSDGLELSYDKEHSNTFVDLGIYSAMNVDLIIHLSGDIHCLLFYYSVGLYDDLELFTSSWCKIFEYERRF